MRNQLNQKLTWYSADFFSMPTKERRLVVSYGSVSGRRFPMSSVNETVDVGNVWMKTRAEVTTRHLCT